ncbi:MAG: phenylalanine--tRNA ligase subunit beta [Mariprofundales bacterium]|nr:phenylalanine--tRNA ligase subunit beta [Mariprofundales bacterium]
MKLPLSWLQSFVALNESTTAIADRLVRLGHEVEGIATPRDDLSKVIIGQILTMEPHPGADRLHLLTIDIGAESPLAIVCGATNMAVGDRVPVATVGATLPGGMVIKRGKIRGEVSCGMCCSEKELALADDAAGLLILPTDAPVATAMGEWLKLESAIFDLSITPNRGDCMSIYGLARELAADIDLPLAPLMGVSTVVDHGVDTPRVTIAAADGAPCYFARRIDGVALADSPSWLQARLRAAGQRPVNGVVDVLNLLMLESGQPMHAFDADRVSGAITVRRASAGEAFAALDGHDYALATEDLVIGDAQGVIALAGIIGGADSAVEESTTSLILESALFAPAGISRSRRRLGIVSEASMRFERGVNPTLVASLLDRATTMVIDLFGGRAGVPVVCGGVSSAARMLTIPVARIRDRLGMDLPEATDGVLRRMGFAIVRDRGNLEVGIPPFRHDVTIAEDMAEEYARIIGYDAIPYALSKLDAAPMPPANRHLEQALAAGLVQVINYAFIDSKEMRLFTLEDGADVVLENPISEAMSVMRRSLFPGLLKSAQYNLNRQLPGVALVEQGRGYRREGDAYVETPLLGWLMAGELEQAQWYGSVRLAEFRDVKGALEQWLSQQGLHARFVADDAITGLQPGQSARILVSREEVGVMGRVQPEIAARFQIDVPVFVAQLRLDGLPQGKSPRYAALPEFPAMVRDLVFLFPKDTTAAAITQAANRAGGKLVEESRIFDRYEGEGVPEGMVSLGVRITLRDTKRTLTQQDGDGVAQAVVAEMAKRFQASLRN